MAEPRPTTILLVGADGFDRHDDIAHVESLSWRRIQRLNNVADHDVVIFDLLSLSDTTSVNWEWWAEHFTYDELRKVLDHQGMVVVLGDPRFNISWEGNAPGLPGRHTVSTAFLSWTGMEFVWDTQPGTTMQGQPWPPFLEIAKHLHGWSYALANVNVARWIAEQELDHLNNRLSGHRESGMRGWGVRVSAVLRNRYDGPLLFVVNKELQDPNAVVIYRGWADLRPRGPIVFVPKLALNEEDSIVLILRDLCDVEIAIPMPGWATSITAPGQGVIDQAIAETKGSIVALSAQLNTHEALRTDARDVLRLLYDTGSSLEVVVRRVLSELGATVEPPVDNKEDGWLTVQLTSGELLEFVIEIKSTKAAQFSEDGLRQLGEWKTRGLVNRHKRYKGMFIGTAARLSSPGERSDPFSSSWRESAALSEVVTLTGDSLLALYRRHRDGALDLNAVWRALYDTNGVFDPSQFLANNQPCV